MTKTLKLDGKGRVHDRVNGRFVAILTPDPPTKTELRNDLIRDLLDVFPVDELASGLKVPLSVVRRLAEEREQWGEFA